ncbi:hypothetical protein FS837_003819 [Tulasnella sp. UAMH 9824]|nr:hypothetical protein FS837_003819 [Tulasnella sp. UAMH 9824]
MDANIADPGPSNQPLTRSQSSQPAFSGNRTDGTDLRRTVLRPSATPRRSSSVVSGHPTTGDTPVTARTFQGSKSSELRSSLEPQIKSEIKGNVVEVEPDAFIRAFLYPNSSPLATRDLQMERDFRLATACCEILKTGTSTEKGLVSILQDPDCPRYRNHAFTHINSDVEAEGKLYTPFQKLFTLINEFYRTSLAQEPERFNVDEAWHAPLDPNPLKVGKTRYTAKLLRRDFFDTHNKPLKFSPRFTGATADLKPDLVLMLHRHEDPSTSIKPESFYWQDVKVPIEAKKAFSSEGKLITQMARYARAILMEQVDRKFVLTVSLSGTQCRLFRWDSVGCHATELINIHENPLLFIQCIGRLATMTPAELGYDEHFSNAGRVVSGDRITTTLTVQNSKIRKYIERTPSPEDPESPPPETPPMILDLDTDSFLFESSGGLFHRYTRVWRGQVVLDLEEWKTGKTHVVKQNWAEDTRPCEGYFYQLTSGITVVPSLVRMEVCDRTRAYHIRVEKDDVIGYLKVAEKKPERQPLKDTTSNLRSGANAKDRSRTPLHEGSEGVQPIERVLLRFVFEEEYRPLSEALSSVEVLHATVQWIQGLIALDGLGIVHRDISYSNLMLPTIDQGYDSFKWSSGELGDSKPAKIIDLGLAHLTEDLQKPGLDGGAEIPQDVSSTTDAPAPAPQAHHHVTGTLPFIAFSLMRKLQGLTDNASIEHALHHDVESVFWVLVYLCHDRAKTVATKAMKETHRKLNSADIDTVASKKADIILDGEILSRVVGPFEELRDFLLDFADYLSTSRRAKKDIDATRALAMAIEHRDKLIGKWKENPALMPEHQPHRLLSNSPIDSTKRKTSAQEDSSDIKEREDKSEEDAGGPRKKTKHDTS